jgi:hypothetical protein
MTSLLERALNLDALKPGAPGVEFSFAHAIPAWGWFAILVASVTIAGWSYWRLVGPRWPRATLAGVRVALFLLIALLISGPQLVKPNERIERDWVPVLLDRSGSMEVPDAGDPGIRRTRLDQQADALRASAPVFASLAKERNLLWLGFDASAYDAPPGASGVPDSTSTPTLGRSTNLTQAIEQALERTAARPVAGLVIVSDGRTSVPPPKALLRRLQSEQIPIFAVPLGSAESPPDRAIARAEAPATVFVNDIVPVNVELAASGAGASERPVRVELVDQDGRVLDAQDVTLASSGDQTATGRTTLASRPDRDGPRSWTVRIAGQTQDLSPDNDRAGVSFEVIVKPLRVLYIDGYPRWEYRYLKNLLIREESIKAQAMLLAANRRYIQEGTDPLAAVPSTPEEWARYDVIILGDVRAELFSESQWQQLREHVSNNGAGLLWIGGSGATPSTWAGTPLADLIPFSTQAGDTGARNQGSLATYAEPVIVGRSPAAERLGLLNLGQNPRDGWPAFLSDPALGWTPLRWAQRIAPASVKPSAEVLATATASGQTPTPLVLTMRYGAGRSVYVATDEIWRWRYARGEELPERFWLPLVRLLARESLDRSGKQAILEISPPRAAVGQPVRVAVKLLDQRLAQTNAPRLTARVAPSDRSDRAASPLPLLADPASLGSFSGTWIGSDAGAFTIEVADAALGGITLKGAVELVLPDDEMQRPQTDHVLLADLASQTGGKVVPPERLSDLPGLLPNRQVRLSDAPEVATLWDTPLALACVFFLLLVEWIGRRLIRLV